MCLEYQNLIFGSLFPVNKEIMITISQDLNVLSHIQSQGNFSIYILTQRTYCYLTNDSWVQGKEFPDPMVLRKLLRLTITI